MLFKFQPLEGVVPDGKELSPNQLIDPHYDHDNSVLSFIPSNLEEESAKAETQQCFPLLSLFWQQWKQKRSVSSRLSSHCRWLAWREIGFSPAVELWHAPVNFIIRFFPLRKEKERNRETQKCYIILCSIFMVTFRDCFLYCTVCDRVLVLHEILITFLIENVNRFELYR